MLINSKLAIISSDALKLYPGLESGARRGFFHNSPWTLEANSEPLSWQWERANMRHSARLNCEEFFPEFSPNPVPGRSPFDGIRVAETGGPSR